MNIVGSVPFIDTGRRRQEYSYEGPRTVIFRESAGFLLMALMSFSFSPGRAATDYFVDGEAGNDSNAGTDAASAWKTVAKVNASQRGFRPGDRVLFRSGQAFHGPLVLGVSGTEGLPITYGAYGEGAKPELTGFAVVMDWRPAGKGIWEAHCSNCTSPVNVLTINGNMHAMGRFPDASAPNGGYLTVDSHVGKTSITDADLPATPNWTGAEVVIRKYRWIIDRNRIVGHEGNTLTYQSGSVYEAVDRHGYFIQNDPRTLDSFGEWYFNPATRSLRLFCGDQDPAKLVVKVGAVDTLVAAGNLHDIVFAGLRFTGANESAISIDSSNRIAIRGCDIRWSGLNAVQGGAVNRLVIEDSAIEDTNNNAVVLKGGVCNSVIRRVVIRNTGMTPGMGASGDGTYNAVTMLGGNDNLIESFAITNTGYIPVHFHGSRITIRGGFIDGFASVKDDSGGIYTWTGTKDDTPYASRIITGNVILNSKGAVAGAVGEAKGFGIYLDDASSNVEVRGNTVAHTSAGIFVHNAHRCRIAGNTLFDNDVQMLFAHDDIAPAVKGEIREIVSTGNILVSRELWQPVLSARSVSDDFDRFGTFERNIYARPADQDLVIDRGVRDALPQACDVKGWQAVTGLDAGTVTSAVRVAPYKILNLGPNLVVNGSFAKDVAGASSWTQNGDSTVKWAEGKLDGGSLHHTYNTSSGGPGTSLVMFNAGALAAGRRYLLRFSILGTKDLGSAGVRLRDGARPWGGLTDYRYIRLETTRRECELLFTAPSDRPASMVEWAFERRFGTFWLDNVMLHEATVTDFDPLNFRLEYNRTDRSNTVALDGEWLDVSGVRYSGTLVMEPRKSLVLIRESARIRP